MHTGIQYIKIFMSGIPPTERKLIGNCCLGTKTQQETADTAREIMQKGRPWKVSQSGHFLKPA